MIDGDRSEADRWLVASKKLLATGDFNGAKTFAIRACEADSTQTEAADYILAISDILVAGESRIENSNLRDWYAMLRVARLTQNPEHVATQYRRLVLLLNPTTNRLPFAERAFKLVCDAWYVLSDPSRKSLYDRELQLSQLDKPGSQNQPQPQQEQQQQPHQSRPNQQPQQARQNQQPPQARQNQQPPQARQFEWQDRTNLEATRNTPTEPTALSFWTACPYCFVLFEYPKDYEECTLRCQHCRRAFQAVTIPTPPVEGEDVYFCSWGVFPLGFSGQIKATGWSPISPLFACPGKKMQEQPSFTKRKEHVDPRVYYDEQPSFTKRKEPVVPRVYYDEDDIYVEISDEEYKPEEDEADLDDDDDDDDDDWVDNETRNKKAKIGKGKEKDARRSSRKQRAGKAGKGGHDDAGDPTASITQKATTVSSSIGGSSNAAGTTSRKRIGTRAKNLGRLDLNVEFSNEAEEPSAAGGKNEGNELGSNREEDNMEGNGFFEGLDEFLSSLPILSVVGDDKVKAN